MACTLDGELLLQSVFDGELGFGSGGSEHGEYTGKTEVTPSRETQILNTAGLVVNQNIKVNPIPSNYGLITWNGSVLTVS